LLDSGSMTRGMGSGRLHGVCSDASPVFVVLEYVSTKN